MSAIEIFLMLIILVFSSIGGPISTIKILNSDHEEAIFVFDANILVIGRCRTVFYDSENPVWTGGYYRGNVTLAGASVSTGKLQPLCRMFVRIRNESFHASFIVRDGFGVGVQNAEGTFYWGRPLKENVTITRIPPIIFFNCHAEKVILLDY